MQIKFAITHYKISVQNRPDSAHLSLHSAIEKHSRGKPLNNGFRSLKELPARTELSELISMDLKKRGFKFIDSTIVYAHYRQPAW